MRKVKRHDEFFQHCHISVVVIVFCQKILGVVDIRLGVEANGMAPTDSNSDGGGDDGGGFSRKGEEYLSRACMCESLVEMR